MNITVLSEDSIALDYFLVKTGSSAGSSPGPDGSAQPSAGVPSAGVKEQGSKTHNTAAIVGGAAVGCLVSLALILAFIFLRRRKARAPHGRFRFFYETSPLTIAFFEIIPKPPL